MPLEPAASPPPQRGPWPDQPLDILVVGTHPDDAEIGLGGSIARWIAQQYRVGILDLTSGEPTPLGTPERRRAETQKANHALGNPWRINLGLPNRNLEPTLIHRRVVAEALRRARPRIVFAPYERDAHPDHVAASLLVQAARFWAKLTKSDLDGEPLPPPRLLFYFSLHLRAPEPAQLALDISSHLDVKLQALQAYRSQLVDNQPYGQPTVIERVLTRDRYWGHLIGVHAAEPIASAELLGLASLHDLTLS